MEGNPILVVLDATEEHDGRVMLIRKEEDASYAVSMAMLAFVKGCIEDGHSPATAVANLFIGLNIAAHYHDNFVTKDMRKALSTVTEAAVNIALKAKEAEKQ